MLKKLVFIAAILCSLAAQGEAGAATVAVATANVNMRAGPGTEYPVVATIPAGSPITAWGCVADYSWCDVTWGGEIGDAIRTTICATCWREWEDMSVKVVNEYRLSMANPEHYRLFVDQLKQFLGMKTEGTG